MSNVERSEILASKSFLDDPMVVFEQAARVRSKLSELVFTDWIRDQWSALRAVVALTNVYSGDDLILETGGHRFLVTGGAGRQFSKEIVVRQGNLAAPSSFTVRFEVGGNSDLASATFSAAVLDSRGCVRQREVVVDSEPDGDLKIKYFLIIHQVI